MKTKNKVYKKFIHIFLVAAIIASSLGFVGIARKTLADQVPTCHINNDGYSGYCDPTVSIEDSGGPYYNGHDIGQVSPGTQIGVDGYISGATVLSGCSQNDGTSYSYVSEFDDIPQPATADVSGPNGTQSLTVQTYDGYGTAYLGHCDPSGSGGAQGDLGGSGAFGGYEYGIDTTGFPDGYYTSDIYLPTGQNEALTFTIDSGNGNGNGNNGSSINVSVVNAPNNETATWYIQTPLSVPVISDSGSSASYPDSAFPTSLDSGDYNIQRDANDYNLMPYGFNMFSYSDTALRNPPTFLARIIKTVEAQSYTCSPSQNCILASGGNITWQLTPTWCVLNVIVEINGVSTQMSGLSYSVSGGVDGSSAVYTSTPQRIMIDADNSGTQFTLNGFPPTIGYGNGTADLVSITPAGTYACNGGSGMTFSANYSTRASLNVQ